MPTLLLLLIHLAWRPHPSTVVGTSHSLNANFSANLHIRRLHKGHLLEYDAELLRKPNGETICHYPWPSHHYLVTNPQGDVWLYNDSTNVAVMKRLPDVDAQGILMVYFLEGTTSIMDMPSFGFSISQTWQEGNATIVEWAAPKGKSKRPRTARVLLVYAQDQLVYMAYYDQEGKLFRKCHFGEFVEVGTQHLPSRITEISYLSATDSLIDDTRFTSMALGENANASLATFTIPEDAILE
jgi:hypothetical protein